MSKIRIFRSYKMIRPFSICVSSIVWCQLKSYNAIISICSRLFRNNWHYLFVAKSAIKMELEKSDIFHCTRSIDHFIGSIFDIRDRNSRRIWIRILSNAQWMCSSRCSFDFALEMWKYIQSTGTVRRVYRSQWVKIIGTVFLYIFMHLKYFHLVKNRQGWRIRCICNAFTLNWMTKSNDCQRDSTGLWWNVRCQHSLCRR